MSIQGSSNAPSAKRAAPPTVAPVEIGELRFSAIHWGRERNFGQNGGYIAAHDRRTGTELWTLKIYNVDYDPELEQDVQDVFIKKLSKTLWGGLLKIADEGGRQYRVDPKTQTVTTL